MDSKSYPTARLFSSTVCCRTALAKALPKVILKQLNGPIFLRKVALNLFLIFSAHQFYLMYNIALFDFDVSKSDRLL